MIFLYKTSLWQSWYYVSQLNVASMKKAYALCRAMTVGNISDMTISQYEIRWSDSLRRTASGGGYWITSLITADLQTNVPFTTGMYSFRILIIVNVKRYEIGIVLETLPPFFTRTFNIILRVIQLKVQILQKYGFYTNRLSQYWSLQNAPILIVLLRYNIY